MDRSTWISANVFQVGGDNLTAPGDCSFYAVRTDDDGLVLIDCGVGGGHRALASNLSRMSHSIADVSSLILTHCHIDHVGGAHIIVAESGCEVVAHEADSDAIEGRRPELTAADWYGVEYVPVKIDRILAVPWISWSAGGPSWLPCILPAIRPAASPCISTTMTAGFSSARTYTVPSRGHGARTSGIGEGQWKSCSP